MVSSRPEPTKITIIPPQLTVTPVPTATPGPVTVYVTGAVLQPEQMIALPAGSRVQDAIDAVGGTTESADLTSVNLAARLRDGDQVHVPEINETLELPTPSGGEIVFINSATIEELMTLPGIGQVTAINIVEYRGVYGAFTSLEDLDEVPGIGPALIEQLADLISFER